MQPNEKKERLGGGVGVSPQGGTASLVVCFSQSLLQIDSGPILRLRDDRAVAKYMGTCSNNIAPIFVRRECPSQYLLQRHTFKVSHRPVVSYRQAANSAEGVEIAKSCSVKGLGLALNSSGVLSPPTAGFLKMLRDIWGSRRMKQF